jgi:pyruvate dehydrogenase E2 component (dihydrolipoamide acetyltransferase)
MPVLGLTMEEGTVAEWLKHEGDSVAKDEPLLTVEMDKGTVEVPSPASGVLRRIVVQPGTVVPVRTVIAEIGAPGEAEVSSGPPGPASAPPGAVADRSGGSPAAAAGGPGDLPPVQASPREIAIVSEAASSGAAPATATGSAASGSPARERERERLFASPRARMRARAMGLDLGSIPGSGPHGRIVEADVLAVSAASEARVVATPLARRLAQEHGVSIADLQGTGPGGRVTQDDVLRAADQQRAAAPTISGQPTLAPSGEVQPLTRIRRITAERMAVSAQATARVSLFLEADLSEAARFRAQLQPEFARLGVAKLPWDALIARAAALALAEHTAVLAQWVDGQGLRRPHDIHVGVAVALEPEGLVVPVLRDADRRSLRELAADLLGLVDKARAGRLSPGEMQGGTFTITNLGAYRIDGFTPIVNPPETAILGVGRIADKPVVVGGKIEARTMCTLSLSFDHRVVDGVPAAAFLARLAELLERPYALLGI